ncbi:MAG TPA: arginine--tRNA ligase [Clostridiales bacterium]|nr:arginine--tRNA ligase [Clostridiales bacterium]
MINVIERMKQDIEYTVSQSIGKAAKNKQLPQIDTCAIFIETPREKGHGDFSTNVAMQMTRQAKMPPVKIASIIIENIIESLKFEDTYIGKVQCAGPGFINFYLKNDWLYYTLKVIQSERENYGRLDVGHGKKIMVEFVSANPTGPLHMGNARGGALGDCIASVLEAAGYDVTREFYVNDAGNQMDKFGISLEARYIQLLRGKNSILFPEDGYHGDDITEHAKKYIEVYGDKLLDYSSDERRNELVKYALEKNLESIKSVLEDYGVRFDVWFSEQSLYDSGELKDTLEYLEENELTYEKDGALWFKTTGFGTDKDEVIVRSNGMPTYFASDIAYHRNKFLKREFDRVINLLGADHHGHVARMKAAVEALGVEPDKLDIIIFQLVRLYRNGEITRMSKRTGKAISLADLLDEAGKDAARFFFNMKASGNHLDFDLDLAVRQSNENPVFYVQYAHARICSMLKLLESEGIRVPDVEQVDLTPLKENEEIELIKKLAEYPEEVGISAQTLEPSRLTRYVMDVASLFHSFYNACRVKGEEENLMMARLILVDSTKIVIKNILDLLSITAPEKM